jgi:hypothetical protein
VQASVTGGFFVYPTPAVLAVLVGERHRSIARDYAFARRFRLRSRTAAVLSRLASALAAIASFVDDDQRGTSVA